MIGVESRVMSPGYLALRIAPLVFVALGCTEPGAVELVFDLPEKAELSPLTGDRLEEISLITWDGAGEQSSETRALSGPGANIDLGRLDIGDELTIGVELRSFGERLIGFGRSTESIVVSGSDVIEVPISLRRPFVYVPGGGQDPLGPLTSTLATFDSTLDGLDSSPKPQAPEYKGQIASPMTTSAVAPTADGRELIVVGTSGASGALLVVSTALHETTSAAQVSLAANPVDVSVTGHGRFAVVAHSGAAGGVSVVDLEEVRAGNTEAVQFAALGSVGAVCAVGRGQQAGRAFALVDRAPTRFDLLDNDQASRQAFRGARVGCSAPSSSIAVLDLADPNPAELGVIHDLGTPIQDIATTDDGSAVIVADACGDRIAAMDPDTGTVSPLLSLLDASSVAVQGARVVAAGVARNGGLATIELLSANLDGTDENRIALPQRQERGVLDDTDPTETIEIVIDADDVFPYDLAAAPDGQHVSLLAEAYHHANDTGITPETEIDTYEYMLVDTASGAVVHRVRSYCLVRVAFNPFAIPPECTDTPGQDAIPDAQMYVPFHLSVLYGDR